MTTTAPHLDVDLEGLDVLVTTPGYALDIQVDMPSIDIGVSGPVGPVGPPGVVKVEHGADPDVARPDYPLVYWVGTVRPNNGDPDDLLMLKD